MAATVALSVLHRAAIGAGAAAAGAATGFLGYRSITALRVLVDNWQAAPWNKKAAQIIQFAGCLLAAFGTGYSTFLLGKLSILGIGALTTALLPLAGAVATLAATGCALFANEFFPSFMDNWQKNPSPLDRLLKVAFLVACAVATCAFVYTAMLISELAILGTGTLQGVMAPALIGGVAAIPLVLFAAKIFLFSRKSDAPPVSPQP